MTISTSVGRERTVGDIVRLAYQSCGLLHVSQTPDVSMREFGRQKLEEILDTLQTYGAMARAVTFYDLTLAADTYRYTMPAYALDVIGEGAYISPAANANGLDRATSETVVVRKDREFWNRISAKGATSSNPTIYYPRMDSAPMQVWLWPIPREAGTVRFQVHRKLADADADSATLELQGFWSEYISYALQVALSAGSTLPEATIRRIEEKAQNLLMRCRGQANQSQPNMLQLDHRIHQ
jgi:hypothetical protein